MKISADPKAGSSLPSSGMRFPSDNFMLVVWIGCAAVIIHVGVGMKRSRECACIKSRRIHLRHPLAGAELLGSGPRREHMASSIPMP